jgi:hypothetical protein
MNDDFKENAKQQFERAMKITQDQSEEAAKHLGGFLRFGAGKLREAADKAKKAIQDDINSRS